jgi:3-isopropylmalate/(R)-2-methylmalate dehydratase large subunit
MFTSRAEYRLTLRADNADQRLTPLAVVAGIVSAPRQAAFTAKAREMEAATALVHGIQYTPGEAAALGIHVNADGQRRSIRDLLAFPGVDLTQFEAVYPDADACYLAVREVDLGSLEPLVAFPDSVIENSQPVSAAAGTPIDQAFVGSCANGTLEDLTLVAQVLQGRRVSPKVRFLVTPGSQGIYREAVRSGVIGTLLDAGAVVTPATCGACGGGHMGVLGPNETCITATTRNFKGRMGDPSAKIYMGSPATVAASAIAGAITDPREFLH